MFPSWDDKPAKDTKVSLDPFDTSLLGNGIPNYVLDPESFGGDDFAPLATPEQEAAIADLYSNKSYETWHRLQREDLQAIGDAKKAEQMQSIISGNIFHQGEGTNKGFDKDAAWIQTHSGRRFCPTNPNPDAIVIQDIAHALSMQCRFSGHCKKFYSVAQHSVLVSYICDSQDALWGLMHDASEAYLVDIPRPLKQSGKLNGYVEFERVMQEAVCRRFGLPMKEPPSVKKADTVLLATEARDLMSPLHSDWQQPVEPLPFLIEAWGPDKAKDMFMKRFFELAGFSELHYQHYLKYRDQL